MRVGVVDGKGDGVTEGAVVTESVGMEAGAELVIVGAEGAALLHPTISNPITIKLRANNSIFLFMGQYSSLTLG